MTDAQTKPVDLTAVWAREAVCESPNLSSGAVRLYCRLLDLALNPDFYKPGPKGQVLIAQVNLGDMIKCSESSIRRRSHELILEKVIWIARVPRPNTKPMIRYYITAYIEKKQATPERLGDGLWGNGRRRFDDQLEVVRGATGQFRRLGGLLFDQFGNKIFSRIHENTSVNGQKRALGAADLTAGSGQNWQVGAVKIDRSERPPVTAHSGQHCPLPAVKPAAQSNQECPTREESPVRVGDYLREGPPFPPDKAFEEWVKGFGKDPFRSKLERARDDLRKALSRSKTDAGRAECKRRLDWLQEKLVVPREAPAPAKSPALAAHAEKPKPAKMPLAVMKEKFAAAKKQAHL